MQRHKQRQLSFPYSSDLRQSRTETEISFSTRSLKHSTHQSFPCQTWDKILKNFEKSKFWSYWYWFWYWKLQFQNIDFDIDIEICIYKILILILILKFLGILILILVLILKKNGGNIENFRSENEASWPPRPWVFAWFFIFPL